MTEPEHLADGDLFTWPFPSIPIEDVLALSEADRACIEQALLNFIRESDSSD